MEYGAPIMLNIESSRLQIGFNTDFYPLFEISLLDNKTSHIQSSNEIYALNKYPIQHGEIEDWNDLTNSFDKIYKKLNIQDNDHQILIAMPQYNSNSAKEKIYEIFFEAYNFPAIQIAPPPILALYSEGLVNGICVYSEIDQIQAIPIHENMIIEDKIEKLNMGYNNLIDLILSNLRRKYYSSFINGFEISQIIYQMINDFFFVSQDFDNDLMVANETTAYVFNFIYKGMNIKLSKERFEIPETLLFKYNTPIHQFIDKKIIQYKKDFGVKFYTICYGDLFRIPGSINRIRKELYAMNTKNEYYISHFNNSVYNGGLVLLNSSKNESKSWKLRQ